MPTAGLCRVGAWPDVKMRRIPCLVRYLTRHNQRPSRKAKSLSSGRYRRGLTSTGANSGQGLFLETQVRMKVHLGGLD